MKTEQLTPAKEKEYREIRLMQLDADRVELEETKKSLLTMRLTSPHPINEVIDVMLDDLKYRIADERDAIKALDVS